MGYEHVGAGLPRRLLSLAVSAVWIIGAVVVGVYLWPSSLGGCTTLTIVSGESMEPTYYTGDLVVSRCGASEVGQVVVYNPPNVGGARVIHRIIAGDAESGWVIRGDNNDFNDPWHVSEDNVLGHAVLHLPQVGTFAAILLSPLTWISLLIVALAVVVWPGKSSDEDVEPEALPAGARPDAEPPEPSEKESEEVLT